MIDSSERGALLGMGTVKATRLRSNIFLVIYAYFSVSNIVEPISFSVDTIRGPFELLLDRYGES